MTKVRPQWWFIKVFTGQLPTSQDPGWRPSMVFFQVDNDVKGLALFTTWAKAEAFTGPLSAHCSLKIEIAELGGKDGVPIPVYVAALTAHVRKVERALTRYPVYVDPQTATAKGRKTRPRFPTCSATS